MPEDNRYSGPLEYWALHEAAAKNAYWQGRSIGGQELKALPLHAQAFFAARCAMRARNLLIRCRNLAPDDEHRINELIDFVVRLSSGKSGLEMAEAFREADKRYREFGSLLTLHDHKDIIIDECLASIYDAGRVSARAAAQLASLPNQYDPASAAHSCYRHIATAAFVQAGNRLSQVHRGMEADLEVLKYYSNREKWTRESTIEGDFFDWRAEFDILKRYEIGDVHFATIRELAQGWNAALNDRFVNFPRELFEASNDALRKILTALFHPSGFVADLILPSRDAGAFLVALRHENSDLRELLLLSRHAPGGNEALVAVNRLHGLRVGTNCVLQFTTAFLLTKPADYSLQVAPSLLKKFGVRQEDLGRCTYWLSKHQESELRRCDSM